MEIHQAGHIAGHAGDLLEFHQRQHPDYLPGMQAVSILPKMEHQELHGYMVTAKLETPACRSCAAY